MNVRKYTETRLKNIRACLEQYKDTSDPDVLHQFRVEIKKLKTVYLLMEKCDPDFNATKKFRIHQNIFRHSGKIRDLDVMLDILKKHQIDQPASADNNEKHKEIRKFCECIPCYLDQLEKKEKRLLLDADKIKKESVISYLQQREEKVLQLLNQKDYKTDLHRVRKISKHILYLSKAAPSYSSERVADYDRLQKAIGSWHDKKVLIKWIKNQSPDKSLNLIAQLRTETETVLETINRLKNKLNRYK